MGRAKRVATCVLVLLSAWSSATTAQILSSPAFGVTPYGWFHGLEGNVGVGPVGTNAQLRFQDVSKALKFMAMAQGDARFGHFVVGLDVAHMAFGDVRVIAFRGDTGNYRLEDRQTIVHPTAGISVPHESWTVDVLAGARIWNVFADLDVDRPSGSADVQSETRSWVDLTGGIRGRFTPGYSIWVSGGVDVGVGASDATWQGYGSLGKSFTPAWQAAVGYRFLAVDYDHNGFLYDTDLHGFTVSLTYTHGARKIPATASR